MTDCRAVVASLVFAELGLDGFWASRLPPSRKGTDWLAIMKTIVMYRLTDPGSELDMHMNWLADTAVEEHIFTAFMALCLQQTLRSIAREYAPGLTPRQIVEKFRTVKMVDVVMPIVSAARLFRRG